MHDIKRMQSAYLESNRREYEITKQISLAQLDPLALVRLRATASTDFEVPERPTTWTIPGTTSAG